jgi:hypothetical protein
MWQHTNYLEVERRSVDTLESLLAMDVEAQTMGKEGLAILVPMAMQFILRPVSLIALEIGQ